MTDQELLESLEACTLPPAAFRHRDHLRAAWAYLERMSFGAALDRMRLSLQRYAAGQGHPGRYHETLTVAYMSLVQAHRIVRPGGNWDEFAMLNPELFEPDLVSRYYDRATLESPLARRIFVLEPRPGLDDA